MRKKFLVVSEQAMRVLKRPESKAKMLIFFGVKDMRTIDSYLANNVPQGQIVNPNLLAIVREHAPDFQEKNFFERVSMAEVVKKNKSKKGISKKSKRNEKNGKNHQAAE